MSFYIRNVKIDGQVVLAPMAGVTNLMYRKMAKKYGASLVYSEMISDNGIYYNDKKTFEMMKIDPHEHPFAMQIFGGNLDTLLNAAKYVDEKTDADIIDINMGCPVPKVLKARAGSYYLLDVQRIYETVKTIVENVKKPVSVKIRIGYDHDNINALEVAKTIKKGGASAITIHGRTKTDLYSGKVDYEIIKKIKEELGDFPVIVNGDITSPEKAKQVLEYTKCEAVMIGRATYGNPYIFKQINHYLKCNELLPNQNIEQKKNELLEYAKNMVALKGEYIGIRELRQHAGWFIKSCYDSAKIRNELTKITSLEELKIIIRKID